MKQSIVILSGTPSGKTVFANTSKNSCWIWNINLKNSLQDIARSMGWKGEIKDKDFYGFLEELVRLGSKFFSFEKNSLVEKIESFTTTAGEHDFMQDADGKKFENFLLVLHGVTRSVAEELKEEYGAMHIMISGLPPEGEEYKETWGDYHLYEDAPDFKKDIEKLIGVLFDGRYD